MSEWISFKDKVPIKGQIVIVWNKASDTNQRTCKAGHYELWLWDELYKEHLHQ